MRVTRVVLRAGVASFRHPFFVTGRQPTFDVPPPSTVHGQCAAALGRWPDPREFFFGLHFTYRARAGDLEHQHIAKPLPAGTRATVPASGGPVRATTEVTVQPVQRDFLFDCRLTLYLPPEVGAAFRAPVFPLVMGRSQDLAEVHGVDEIELRRPERARLEHTLLPRALRPCVRFGTTVLLTRHIAEPPGRQAAFAQYIALHEHVLYGETADESRAVTQVPGIEWPDLWADGEHVDDEGYPRGVYLLRLVD